MFEKPLLFRHIHVIIIFMFEFLMRQLLNNVCSLVYLDSYHLGDIKKYIEILVSKKVNYTIRVLTIIFKKKMVLEVIEQHNWLLNDLGADYLQRFFHCL